MIIKRTSLFSTLELVFLLGLLIAMILFPAFTFTNVAILFSLLLVVKGLFSFIDGLVNLGFMSGAIWELLYGFISLILGFYILSDPLIGAVTVTYLLAGWIALSGFANILEGVLIRKTYTGELTLVIGGVLSIAFALFFFIYPWTTLEPFVWFVSIYLVIHIIFSWAQMERITVYELREGK